MIDKPVHAVSFINVILRFMDNLLSSSIHDLTFTCLTESGRRPVARKTRYFDMK